MATIQDMKDGINTLLASVTGIGKVYKMRKIVKKPADFASTFTAGDPAIINTWEITNRSIPEAPAGIGSGANIRERTWDWQIEGWYQFNYNDSEATFDNLVEAICAKFRGQNNIGGELCQSDIMQVEVKDVEGFGGGHPEQEGILCHHAVLSVPISLIM